MLREGNGMAERKPFIWKDPEAPICEVCGHNSKTKLEEVYLCKHCESIAKNARKDPINTICKYKGECNGNCTNCRTKKFIFLAEGKKAAESITQAVDNVNPNHFAAENTTKSADQISPKHTAVLYPFRGLQNMFSPDGKARGRGKAQLIPEGRDKAEPKLEGRGKAEPTLEGQDKAEPKLEGQDKEPTLEGQDTAEPTLEGQDKAEPTLEGRDKAEQTLEGHIEVQIMPEAPAIALKEEEVPPVCHLDVSVIEVTPTKIKLTIVPLDEAKWSLFGISYYGTSPQGVKGNEMYQEFKKGSAYVIDNLVPGYCYKLAVIAKSDEFQDEKSDELMVNLPVASVPSQCMFKFSECSQQDRFTVFWKQPLSNGSPIKFYKISWALDDSPVFNPAFSAIITPSDDPCYTLRNLRPGTLYQVGVEAYNDIGASAMNIITLQTAFAEKIETKPYLDLMMPQSKHIGEKLVLKVGFFGTPKPVVQWTKDGNQLADNVKMSESENYSILEIENVSFADAGLYTAHAGDESSSVQVQVIDESSLSEHDFQLIEIGINEDLYHTIVAEMNRTMINYQIHKIYKINNKVLWDKYVSSYKHFENECGSANEKILFYGCSSKESILKYGFDLKLALKSDKYCLDQNVFCFSESAAAANECAFDEKQCEHARSGKTCFECMRYIFLVRVVLGHQQHFYPHMVLPKSGAYYHSVLATPKDKEEKEVLIFNGEQAYCDVLIEYVMCEN